MGRMTLEKRPLVRYDRCVLTVEKTGSLTEKMDFTPKDSYTVSDLVSIMALLRSDGGCPWDREQTHRSIRKNVIEEAYEVADAIDRENSDALCEELGDLLLQVVFQSRMSEEEGGFDFDDVADGICRKLIRRHPHIFAQREAGDPDEVLALWEEIKIREKGQSTVLQTLTAVPDCFPALMRCQKLQSRAARAGFRYPGIQAAVSVLRTEIAGLESALAQPKTPVPEEKIGDLLFSVTAISQMLGIDAEESLSDVCRTFVNRFAEAERIAKKRQIDMKEASEEQLLLLWEEAKNRL